MNVHLPNGRITRVSPAAAATARVFGDLCPRADEHDPLPSLKRQRRMVAELHLPCGLPVIWRSR